MPRIDRIALAIALCSLLGLTACVVEPFGGGGGERGHEHDDRHEDHHEDRDEHRHDFGEHQSERLGQVLPCCDFSANPQVRPAIYVPALPGRKPAPTWS
jgi:hypothetical protein